jgi:hypothetical protein
VEEGRGGLDSARLNLVIWWGFGARDASPANANEMTVPGRVITLLETGAFVMVFSKIICAFLTLSPLALAACAANHQKEADNASSYQLSNCSININSLGGFDIRHCKVGDQQ